MFTRPCCKYLLIYILHNCFLGLFLRIVKDLKVAPCIYNVYSTCINHIIIRKNHLMIICREEDISFKMFSGMGTLKKYVTQILRFLTHLTPFVTHCNVQTYDPPALHNAGAFDSPYYTKMKKQVYL